MEKRSVSRLSYLFAHLHLLSSYSFSSELLSSNLPLLPASALLCFSSVHIVGSLTSKLPSTIKILVLTELATNCIGYVVVTSDTRKVKGQVCKWLDHFGLASSTSSVVLHTDAERAVSELVGTSSEKYTFMVRRARPQQHQSNGGAERAVRRLKESLAVLRAEMNEGGADVNFSARGLSDVCTYIALSQNHFSDIVETFEAHFGKVKSQTIPCDPSIQLQDVSQPLSQVDTGWYRSVVGSCLYLGRDRPDLVFTIKELASRMAKPTLNALQHLRKMVGYLRTTGELGINLHVPAAGQGEWKSCVDKFWILETYSDADWAANKGHRKSTSCSIHFLNGYYVFGAARTQRVIALSCCESELHSIVSGMRGAIYIRRILEFILNVQILQVHYTLDLSNSCLYNKTLKPLFKRRPEKKKKLKHKPVV